ncbi:arginyl-tRNA--protein transferase 1 isoform X7 [Anguilla rostrata]|uniref:arginyl-tRNA--protein transferase 1 isoform X7 n=1 Tax=Anguilla rostrata TaxID=7938 RepID=UPI0030D2F2D4
MYSIVEIKGVKSKYRCGYCGCGMGKVSFGMWAHAMTVQDYQDLVDRGWRRSGKYVYKPIMDETCCPQYTIRCHALNFQPSKTHKKNLKKMSKFLSKGEMPTECDGEPMDSVCEEGRPRETPKACSSDVQEPVDAVAPEKEAAPQPAQPDTPQQAPKPEAPITGPPAMPKPGVGADPSRPPCRKAKDLRKERRQQKEQQRQQEGGASSAGSAPACAPPTQSRTLEDLIAESLPEDAKHRLEVKLVPVSFEDPQFMATFDQSAALYARYQTAVHGDAPSECGESEFRRFLCDSPLEEETAPDGPEAGYGSFHQQYWLDGRIVAVGVIDVLPTCVSSVYLYYHPDCAALSLGTYSALREIAFTRQLQGQSPKLCYYYLGFYIHSCPKMRYKGQYRPSDLLCPETYAWVPIEQCVPRLESAAYARFNQDIDAVDERFLKDLDRVLVLHRRAVMPYAAYARKRRGPSDEREVEQYARLVGQACAERMLLYRA